MNTTDARYAISLQILRGELQNRTEKHLMKDAVVVQKSSSCSHNLAAGSQRKFMPITDEHHLQSLKNSLKEQLKEQEKWNRLTLDLTQALRKNKQEQVRLNTTVKVFQDELAQRNQRVDRLQGRQIEKEGNANAHIQALEIEIQKQKEQKERAEEAVERINNLYKKKQAEKARLEKEIQNKVVELDDAEDRVSNLEWNVKDNRLSDDQLEHLQAELQRETTDEDKCRETVSGLTKEFKELEKECQTLNSKYELFVDEVQRRKFKIASLEAKVKEQQEFFKTQLETFREELDAAQEDRDDWEGKVAGLKQTLKTTETREGELTVKVDLFQKQLVNVEQVVEHLRTKVYGSADLLTGGGKEPKNNKDDEESKDMGAIPSPDKPVQIRRQPSPTSVRQDVMVNLIEKREEPVINRVMPQISHPSSNFSTRSSISTSDSSRITQDTLHTRKVAKAADVHPQDRYDETPTSPRRSKDLTEKMLVAATTNLSSDGNVSDTSVQGQIQTLQRDLMAQKRFQKENTLKLEKQIAHLTSKIDILADDMEGMLAVKAKWDVQHDAMQVNHQLRTMLEEMNGQFVNLANKMELLAADIKKRDEHSARLEQKLQERDTQLEQMRKEMEKQLTQQQLVFQDRMTEAVTQMQRLTVTNHGNASLRSVASMNSMGSLEPLYPAESPQREIQVRFVEVPTGQPNLFVSRENGDGFGMAAGIMMNNPLFTSMTAAVAKGSYSAKEGNDKLQ